ncbi:MAG: PhnD/SsuA/transferrin family substrate-binding protein, partial [Candidatus Riflebacteria bacterium]|nr:PhnD/SsuA/transferrin family substrate-binding protein [Candidatus Riflebacteria bacterium]
STDQLPGMLTPLKELEKRSISHSDFFRQEFYSDNYSDSILGLQNDQFDCIVLTSNFFLEQSKETRDGMKIIHESPPLPGGVYIISTSRPNPFVQTIVGNLMKFGAQQQASEAFSGMFTTRQPDEAVFDSLEKEFINEP